MEWTVVETSPIAPSARSHAIVGPGATYGVMIVESCSTQVESFCPNWNVVDTYYFGDLASAVRVHMFVDFDELSTYLLNDGKYYGHLSFSDSSTTIHSNRPSMNGKARNSAA